jgi:hypothetical protein
MWKKHTTDEKIEGIIQELLNAKVEHSKEIFNYAIMKNRILKKKKKNKKRDMFLIQTYEVLTSIEKNNRFSKYIEVVKSIFMNIIMA